MCRRWLALSLLALAVTVAVADRAIESSAATPAPPRAEQVPIDHLIVIFLENRSFDHLYGRFPRANGLRRPGARITQTDRSGEAYRVLPPVRVGWGKTDPDPRFPAAFPNAPFLIDPYVPSSQKTPDPVHRYYQHILQINGGKMDRYDSTFYDHTSILRFIEWRWRLEPLATRDAAANNLLNAFDFRPRR